MSFAPMSLTPTQPRGLSLFCWVLEISDRSFSVDIEDNLTVGHLKDAIVKKNPISFDAYKLDLWKTSIPIDREIKNHVGNQQFHENDVLLEGDLLEEIFPLPEPAEKTLHIVVRHPRPQFHEFKRLRLNIDAPRTPTKVRGDDSEMPQTPVRSQVAPVKRTPPRLRRRELIPAMEVALRPFTRFMSDLAEGKLDKYFDPTQLEPWGTHHGVVLPNGPMLILHNLGNYPDDERLSGIFKSDTVQLYAVSGSGKTRLCLEGLCHQWGFYISCRGISKNRAAGSTDFLLATQIMTEMSSWDEREETDGVVDPNKNINVARRVFEMLICARLFVLQRLLEKLPPGTDETTARRRWVLVQAMPPSVRDDIFSIVLKSLRCADSRDMGDLIESMLADMTKIIGESIFPSTQKLIAVIDESQVAAEYLSEAFRSLTTARPVLHLFYRFLHDVNFIKGIILAGTSLSMEMVKKSVSSRSAQLLDESRNPLIFHDIGLFLDSGTDHKAYLEKYLTFASTVSDGRLMQRLLYWLSGRYRFTASLIELLLFTQSTSRHRVLSAFIHALTGFRVTDAIDLEEEEPRLTNGISEHIENFYGPVGDEGRLFGKFKGHDLICIFNALMRWRIGSQLTSIRIEGDMHQTIASGIGQLKVIKPDRLVDTIHTKDKRFAYLCEPLVVLHLSSTFAQRKETTNLSWLSDATFTARNNSSLGFMFEEAVLMIILQMFGGEPRALSDAFHTDQPWGERKVVLVSLKLGADGEMYSCPVSWTSGSSDRLGFKASSPNAILEFLNNPDGKCFLFPDDHMGPDLSWFFQDWETKELMFADAQCKPLETLTPAKHQRVLQTVDPDFFYTVKNRKGDHVQYAPLKYPDLLDVKSALDVKLGPDEYQPSVIVQHPKIHSVIEREEQSASQPGPQRLIPRYLRIIATPNDHQRERLKAEWKGDVGVLRSECVKLYFPDIVWITPPSVA